jgi:hypothetical protein
MVTGGLKTFKLPTYSLWARGFGYLPRRELPVINVGLTHAVFLLLCFNSYALRNCS